MGLLKIEMAQRTTGQGASIALRRAPAPYADGRDRLTPEVFSEPG